MTEKITQRYTKKTQSFTEKIRNERLDIRIQKTVKAIQGYRKISREGVKKKITERFIKHFRN